MSRLTTDEKLLSQGKTCECIAAIAQRLADFFYFKDFFLYFCRNNWFPVGFSILDTNSYTFLLM